MNPDTTTGRRLIIQKQCGMKCDVTVVISEGTLLVTVANLLRVKPDPEHCSEFKRTREKCRSHMLTGKQRMLCRRAARPRWANTLQYTLFIPKGETGWVTHAQQPHNLREACTI